jgi:hypothetical protein
VNWKGCGRKRPWSYFKLDYYPDICLDNVTKPRKISYWTCDHRANRNLIVIILIFQRLASSTLKQANGAVLPVHGASSSRAPVWNVWRTHISASCSVDREPLLFTLLHSLVDTVLLRVYITQGRNGISIYVTVFMFLSTSGTGQTLLLAGSVSTAINYMWHKTWEISWLTELLKIDPASRGLAFAGQTTYSLYRSHYLLLILLGVSLSVLIFTIFSAAWLHVQVFFMFSY